jgi:hypothetical protein
MHGLELAGVGLAAKVVIDHDQGRQAAGSLTVLQNGITEGQGALLTLARSLPQSVQ